MNKIKLIASDLDHTLLNESGELPKNIEQIVRDLSKLNIDFVAASGRPLYTLRKLFANVADEMSFVSDNGGVIVRRGEVLFESLLDTAAYQEMARFVETKTDGIAIICGLESAYVKREYIEFDSFLKQFYTNVQYVEDLSTLSTKADKFTIYFPNQDSITQFENEFKPRYSDKYSVTVGDTIWIDIMNFGVDKGHAMQILQNKLAISADEMMAFGDTYNDIEMLQAVKYSYLVANASEEMHQYATFMTDSNENGGVISVLQQLIETSGLRE
ncbi:MAG TPA: HAD family hydrolase [Lactobacillaceae bacterium]|jgi:hypothetical protein